MAGLVFWNFIGTEALQYSKSRSLQRKLFRTAKERLHAVGLSQELETSSSASGTTTACLFVLQQVCEHNWNLEFIVFYS